MNLFEHYADASIQASIQVPQRPRQLLGESSHSPMIFIHCAHGRITCANTTAGGRCKVFDGRCVAAQTTGNPFRT